MYSAPYHCADRNLSIFRNSSQFAMREGKSRPQRMNATFAVFLGKRAALAVAALGCICAQVVAATSGNFQHTDNGTSITITGYVNKPSGALVIRSTIKGKPVTSIGENAFYGCSGLTSAEFLGNAPSMGSSVFKSTAGGFAVKYHSGATGFTSPTWHGYPASNMGPLPKVLNKQAFSPSSGLP